MPRRILIVRLSALGDTALTLPLLWALREKLPDAFIGWAVGEPAAALLRPLSNLDRVHVWPRKRRISGLRALLKEIRKEKYDAALDVQGLTKSAIIPFLARIPLRVGFARGGVEGRELAPLLNNRRVRPPAEMKHITARTLHLGTALDLEMPQDAAVELPVDEGAAERMRSWWRENDLTERTIVLGVGAGWPTKVWPVERVAALAAAAGAEDYRAVVLWGPAEKDDLPRWREALGPDALLAPPTDVAEMVALLSLAERYAGPDSAALHLAALLGKPTFSWFGASDPARCAPRGPRHRHVAKDLPCRHCWKRSCPENTCMDELSVEEVRPVFLEWMKES